MTRPQATPAQLDGLTFPALPSVVRVCTPVMVGMLRSLGVSLGVVHAIDNGKAILSNCDNPVRLGADSPMVVDLTDATGRMHLLWAIMAADGVDTSGMAWTHVMDRSVVLRSVELNVMPCRALLGLDNSDDTRLPDGSRWVDAEALRLVGVHVLGGAA